MTKLYPKAQPEELIGILQLDSMLAYKENITREKLSSLEIAFQKRISPEESSKLVDEETIARFSILSGDISTMIDELNFSKVIPHMLEQTLNAMFSGLEKDELTNDIATRLLAPLVPVLIHSIYYYKTTVVLENVVKALIDIYDLQYGQGIIEQCQQLLKQAQLGFKRYNEVLKSEALNGLNCVENWIPIETKKPLYKRDYDRLYKRLSNAGNYVEDRRTLYGNVYDAVNITKDFMIFDK